MPAVQLTIGDTTYAERLREALSQDWAFRDWHVKCVPAPDMCEKGVIVLDAEAFSRLPGPLLHPERVVLIGRRDPQQLFRAWKAGVVSVIPREDPLSTAMLAILAARFRAPNSVR
jgi:hypothetical protein